MDMNGSIMSSSERVTPKYVPFCESCNRRKNVQQVVYKKTPLPEWWCTRCKIGWQEET